MRTIWLAFLLLLFSIVFANGITIEGSLILKDNSTILIEGFKYFDDYCFVCQYNNTKSIIPFSKIKRMTILFKSLNDPKSKAKITLKNDEIFYVNGIMIATESNERVLPKIIYFSYDTINSKVIQNTITPDKIKSMIFHKVGDISIDPSSGEKFPSDFRFNPFTGNKLEPGNFRK